MEKQRVIFFTGAGISVDSGIPTFQDQPGIRDKLSREFANEHPEEYRTVIKQMVYQCEKAEPNIAHIAIAETGFPVITMNVDRLHTKAGSNNVIEVHGVLPSKKEVEEKDFPLTYNGIVLYGDIAPKYETPMEINISGNLRSLLSDGISEDAIQKLVGVPIKDENGKQIGVVTNVGISTGFIGGKIYVDNLDSIPRQYSMEMVFDRKG